MTTNKQISTIVGLVVVLIVTCINPIYPNEQFLQHIGTVLLLIPLLLDMKAKRLGPASYVGLSLFTLLHIIGARYIYSNVPYDEFFKDLLGVSVNELMGATRNHYDRLVHFSFGLLLMPMITQVAQRIVKCKRGAAILVAWLFVQTGSMIYELFEWLLTIVMTPDAAENYNGQQGDMWDAQKDMALALLGSTISALLCLVLKDKRESKG